MASTAGNVMSNVATNPTQANLTRSLETQSWTANKENLIYAMSNQIGKFDQLDERFIIFCISKFINSTFDFRKM